MRTEEEIREELKKEIEVLEIYKREPDVELSYSELKIKVLRWVLGEE